MSIDTDVIIVGAGAAGIGAAIELQKSSLSFIILEARNRIGGRAYTDRETFSPYPIDLGASWIHWYEPKNPMYPYYNKYKIEEPQYFESDDEEEIHNLDFDGKPIPREAEEQAKRICDKILKQLDDFAASNQEQEDKSMEHVIKSSYEHLVESEGLIKRIVDSNIAEIEVYDASSMSKLSAKQWQNIDEDTISDKFVAFGYGTLIERIAQHHQILVRLNTIVTRIDSSDPERIMINTSTEGFSMTCRRIIVTVPLGCLKRETIVFEPPLPDWKRQAIATMGFGLFNKFILQFAEQFWESKNLSMLRVCTKERGRFLYTVCLPSPANILMLLIADHYAEDFEKQTDIEILKEAMSFLQQIFPHLTVPNPIKYRFTRWSQDPFTFGSYSNYSLNASAQTTELLARETSDGRVHWAGEHAPVSDDSAYLNAGYVAGAFLSGKRAAAAICHQLQVLPSV